MTNTISYHDDSIESNLLAELIKIFKYETHNISSTEMGNLTTVQGHTGWYTEPFVMIVQVKTPSSSRFDYSTNIYQLTFNLYKNSNRKSLKDRIFCIFITKINYTDDINVIEKIELIGETLINFFNLVEDHIKVPICDYDNSDMFI